MYFLLQFMAKVKPEGAKPMSARFFLFSASISTGHLHTTKVYGGATVSGNAVVGVAHISESGPGPGVASNTSTQHRLCAHRDKWGKNSAQEIRNFLQVFKSK